VYDKFFSWKEKIYLAALTTSGESLSFPTLGTATNNTGFASVNAAHAKPLRLTTSVLAGLSRAGSALPWSQQSRW
jgi:hypothetical protein